MMLPNNLIHDIADVSNNGYYHNTKFKDTAEAHGLLIGKDKKYGWTVTTLAADAATWVKDTMGIEAFRAARLPESTGIKEKQKLQYQVCVLRLRRDHTGHQGNQRLLRRLRRSV